VGGGERSRAAHQLKLVNLDPVPSRGLKLFKLCMRLDLNILNNFLNWVDFKFLVDHML
jgi:hypothetical protein